MTEHQKLTEIENRRLVLAPENERELDINPDDDSFEDICRACGIIVANPHAEYFDELKEKMMEWW